MKTVSFQGLQLTDSERAGIAFRQKVKSAFMHPILSESVDKTLATCEQIKLTSASEFKPVKTWFLDHQSKGTLCIADWIFS